MTRKQQTQLQRLERQLWEDHRAVLEVPAGLPPDLRLAMLRSVFAKIVPSADFQEQRRRHPEKIFHLHVCTGICPACTFQTFCRPEKMAARKAELGRAMGEAFGGQVECGAGSRRGH
jgi:hypothetical protein